MNAAIIPMPTAIPASRVTEFLEHLGGTIFRATFIKKDGSLRTMPCRLHVTKGVKGNGRNPAADFNNPYVTVFAMEGKKSGFRSLNLSTLMEIKTHGHTIEVL